MAAPAGTTAIRTLAEHAALVAALHDPRCWPQPVDAVEQVQTHISTVLLAGDTALKLKKPVALGFLDFTTVEARHAYCLEELRINRRTAPTLYRDVVPISGSLADASQPPRIDGDGPVLDWALRMHRFDQAQRFDLLARGGLLTEPLVDSLARAVADLHLHAARVPHDSPLGSPAVTARWLRATLADLRAQEHAPDERATLDRLAAWVERELTRHHDRLAERHAAGCVRECHGDLHLGNVVVIDDRAVLFDAIEFNPELRWIDTASDLAFTWMDLLDHGQPALAARFISQALEASGDHDGLPLLRLFAVYRALVRARVAQLRLQAAAADAAVREAAALSQRGYLRLAQRLTAPRRARVMLMHGLSGSGKSTVALLLAQALGGVRVRADVERKRLFGLAPNVDSDGTIYTPQATRQTYARLRQVMALALAADLSVVIDAASLRRAERIQLRAAAAMQGAAASIVSCQAPETVMRQRLTARAARGDDASEATVAVLDRQLQMQEPLDDDERLVTQVIETDATLEVVRARVAQAAAQLDSGEWRD